jgi:uncharacterized protein (DUF1800 family)
MNNHCLALVTHRMAAVTERQKCAHLLRRFGLGASQTELDAYMAGGLSGAIDLLLTAEDQPEDPVWSLEGLRNPKNGNLPMPVAINAWVGRLIVTQRPLLERMTLFWHDHFATSAGKVKVAELMIAQNETLRRNALGNFHTLLTEVAKDPAMLFWLDNQENVAGKPNENFAREVMELFTLGIDNYTEQDVREGARAFTGWSFLRERANAAEGKPFSARFVLRPLRHDRGEKVFLGKRGPLDGDDVLNLLASHAATYRHLARKLWERFVYPDPEPLIVDRIAGVLAQTGGEIRPTLRAIMNSPEFFSSKAYRALIKSPVDVVIASMRQLGLGSAFVKNIADGTPRQALAIPSVAAKSMKGMGMHLFYPPTVAGWGQGQSWISTATLVERMAWADKLFSRRFSPAFNLLNADPSPNGIVQTLSTVLDFSVAPERLGILMKGASTNEPLSPSNANLVAARVAKLMFATPEFQFA